MSQAQCGLQTRPVVGLVVHAGRRKFQMDAPDCLVLKIFVIFGDCDLGNYAIRGQTAFDLLLRWDIDRNVTFDGRLTGERESLCNVRIRESKRTAASNVAPGHLHRAATAASL